MLDKGGAFTSIDPKDTTSVDLPVPDYEAAIGRPIKGLRVGIPKEYRVDGMPAEIEKLWQEMFRNEFARGLDVLNSGESAQGAARAGWVLVLMIGLHSLVEYPLWYSYFLLPAAWAWGFALQGRAGGAERGAEGEHSDKGTKD